MSKKKNSEDSLYEEIARRGMRSFHVTTPYGTVIYVFDIKKQKKVFEVMSKTTIAAISRSPAVAEEVFHLSLDPDATEIDLEIIFGSDEEKAEVEKMANGSFEYFNENFALMFVGAMQQFVCESHAVSALRNSGEGLYVMTMSECEFFSNFSKMINKAMRDRMRIEKKSGKPVEWTSKRLLDLLESYNNIRLLVKRARQLYKLVEEDEFSHINNQDNKKIKVMDRVKMAFPELEESIIDKFRHESVSDSELAIEVLNDRLPVKLSTSSIESLLVKARNISREDK